MLRPFRSDFITIDDICQAYRKAKREAFHDTNCAHGNKYADFEKDLESNLQELLKKIIAPQASWFTDAKFLGQVTSIAKSVEGREPDRAHFRLTNPIQDWERTHASKKAVADFRPVIDASVQFQVISALWIIKVGHRFDACLDPRVAVGNRLRRWRASTDAPPHAVGEFNEKSHTLFHPYYVAYGAWREGGLNAMKQELTEGRHIVAVTMDLKRFYHQVDPTFLLDRRYLAAAGIVLDTDQRNFTKQMIEAIKTWNIAAEKLTGKNQFGLPVGLTASSVIANVLLKEFDTGIQKLRPAYYGRYVDDIFLVLRHSGFSDSKELMRWLDKKLGAIATYKEDIDESPMLEINFPYGGKSELLFMGKKQKVFQLEGQHGLDLISPIEEQIRRQKSEHQGLPDLPDREAEMAARALLVSSDATLDADALRKADAVTLRRAGFAMLLSAVEQHAHHVDYKSWRDVRRQFYGLAERHLLTPRGFFDYAKYIPRILGVMVACRDVQRAAAYVRLFARVLKVVEKTCDHHEREFTACKRNLARRMIESVMQAPSVERRHLRVLSLIRSIISNLSPSILVPRSESTIRMQAEGLFLADWSRRAYGPSWLESHSLTVAIKYRPKKQAIRRFIQFDSFRQLRKTALITQPFHWPALAFPTRPIAIPDLTAYAPNLLRNYDELAQMVQALRGTWTARDSALFTKAPSSKRPETLHIPTTHSSVVRVAVTNFRTEYDEWKSAVKEQPVHSLGRYRRINRFINDVLKKRPRAAYILLPECSLPRRWARDVATKLSLKKISLIAGLEYVRGSIGIRNEAIVSLHSNFIGYNTNVVILQPKLSFAWGERSEIAKLANLGLEPPLSNAFKRPVYAHGKFCFSVLICSDFTTLENRALLQGHIDCLFVPEWNQDLETFVALVEASTHDLHAYVVQANNRLYGDSRIRAPYKQNYKRDVVRIRGGLHDYFVTDEIDVSGLRKFQANETPPTDKEAQFKPFPVGFKLSTLRGGSTA